MAVDIGFARNLPGTVDHSSLTCELSVKLGLSTAWQLDFSSTPNRMGLHKSVVHMVHRGLYLESSKC